MGTSIKFCILVFTGMASLVFIGCGGGATGSPSTPAVHNEWTWMSGSNELNQHGSYGTLDTPASSNTPGARTSPSSWTDSSGGLWLFGGYGLGSNGAGGDLNDLWKYSGGKWTWVVGSAMIEAKGVYGTKGVSAPTNVPGARYEAASWTDAYGNFWLFGGLGIDSTGTRGELNDLWEFSNGEWKWTGGSNVAADPTTPAAGIYGIQGVASPGNTPGARFEETTWADHAGNLWLLGGEGFDSTGALGLLTDLWKYSNGEWTWMSGPNTTAPLFQPGIYGTLGTPDPNNIPGPRTGAAGWADADDNLWLFGGQGNDSTGGAVCSASGATFCFLNDLWKYSSGEWTWMGGSSLNNEPGTYGTKGTAASANIPGARWLAVSWMDAAGNVWLFGGTGLDSTTGAYTVFGDLNDQWKLSGGQWTWTGGSNLASSTPTGIYGTQGEPSASNVPTQRETAVGWVDSSGYLWLFGGDDSWVSYGGKLNDLWEYQP